MQSIVQLPYNIYHALNKLWLRTRRSRAPIKKCALITKVRLLTATNDWFDHLDKHKEVGAVFFDLKKAFDSVPHRALMETLQSLHLHPGVLNWVHQYLCNRSQQVVVNGEVSTAMPVLSGVPQGSILGPLLFLVYINSVEDLPFSSGTKIVLFADDMLVYRPIECASDELLLQSDVDLLAAWVNEHHLTLNTSKCKYMVISRRRSTSSNTLSSLTLNDIPLEKVSSFKYLGVIIDSSLSWSDHIQKTVLKAKRLVGSLYRQYYQFADTKVL